MKRTLVALSVVASCLVDCALAQTPDAPKEPTVISGKSSAKRNGSKLSIAAATDAGDATEPVLRLNFRAAPMESVLSYLSEAAGYTIILKTPLRGTVDVWNDAPLSKSEALGVLNIALAKNGLAAIADGRKLTIVTQADAKNGNIPIRSGSKPEEIPNNDEIVTQIMPLSHINAAQLIRDLDTLLPKTASVTSNEAGNVVVITDSQANIRHFAEIVEAIDTSMSSIAGIKVFPLHFADSKTLASVVKDLFAPDTSNSGGRNGGGGSPFGGATSRFGGGGGPGGGGFGGGGPGGFGGGAPGGFGGGNPTGGGSTGGRTPTASRVIAVSDDRSNSLVVTAPEDLMGTIEQLVKAVDVSVDDLTEIRVFRLKYSDPNEMSDLLSNLFPDDTKSNNANNNNTSRFGNPFAGFGGGPGGGGPGGGGPGGGGGTGAGATSDRAKKMARVIAVPDPRTVSVVVTTSHDLMRQVEQMITQLDSAKGRNQVVKVYSLDNADALAVQQVLQDLFPTQSKSNSRNTANLTSALTSRASAQVQSQGAGSTSFGSTGGGGGKSGGTGGGAIP